MQTLPLHELAVRLCYKCALSATHACLCWHSSMSFSMARCTLEFCAILWRRCLESRRTGGRAAVLQMHLVLK